jgi:hypothetical protein
LQSSGGEKEQQAAKGSDHEQRSSRVSFKVDDIDSAYRDPSAYGVAFPQPPEKRTWGSTPAFPRDPDGNILTLVG